MRLQTTKQVRQAIRDVYAWPGGYPTFLICTDGGILCHKCARQEYKQVSDAVRHPDTNTQWQVFAIEINYEDSNLICDHCNQLIECAYCE